MKNVYSIIEFGAKADAETNTSRALQAAIDHCHASGGGTVYVPPGNYMTGVIFLKSQVHLYLEHGARLLGSPQLSDYEHECERYGMIVARHCEHVSISGGGILDANGDVFMDLTHKAMIKGQDFAFAHTRQGQAFGRYHGEDPDGAVCHGERPFQMLIFSECRNITIRDITIKNAPCWTLHLHDSENINVMGVRILNQRYVPNNDGLDITCCRNVHVSDCHIEAGDDAIAITGFNWHEGFPGYNETPNPCENVTISNCTLLSRSAGIRLGAGKNNISNVIINNVVIRDSNRGIIVWVRDGNTISDVTCSNIFIQTRFHTGCWWGKSEPIALSVLKREPESCLGKIERVSFSNITASSNSGIILNSAENGAISNIAFHHIRLRVDSHPYHMAVGGNFDFRPNWSLDQAVFAHDIPGLFAKNIDTLDIDGFNYSPSEALEEYYRHAVWLEDCVVAYLSRVRANFGGTNRDEALRLDNCKDIDISDCRVITSAETIILDERTSIQGADSQDGSSWLLSNRLG